MQFEESTKSVSNRAKKAIGITCALIFSALGISSYWHADPIVVIWFFVAGIPLGLLSISLLFGNAKAGKGIFSSATLYIVGSLLGLAVLLAVLSGKGKASFILVFVFAIFALAKSRKNSN